MDKVHKYAEKYCDEVKISSQGNSHYYHFNGGKFVLRISDHIGRNSDGKISIIIDKENGYLLHNHNTGAVYIETYENIKEIIKSLSTLSKVHLHLDISKYETGMLKCEVNALKMQKESLEKKNKTLVDNNNRIIKDNVSYKQKLKAITKENEILREEFRRHPIRTWYKMFVRYQKNNNNNFLKKVIKIFGQFKKKLYLCSVIKKI